MYTTLPLPLISTITTNSPAQHDNVASWRHVLCWFSPQPHPCHMYARPPPPPPLLPTPSPLPHLLNTTTLPFGCTSYMYSAGVSPQPPPVHMYAPRPHLNLYQHHHNHSLTCSARPHCQLAEPRTACTQQRMHQGCLGASASAPQSTWHARDAAATGGRCCSKWWLWRWW